MVIKIKNYSGAEKLGSGAHGVVYRCCDIDTGEEVAIKKIKLNDKELSEQVLRECSIHKELDHPNVVRLEEVLCDGKEIYLVMEKLGADMKEYRRRNPFMSEDNVKVFLKMLLSGVEYFHARNVVHRDLKPTNLLLDLNTSPPTLKVADFGIARIRDMKMTPGVGTLAYMAPERLLRAKYSEAVDMWGIGCVFAEMASWIDGLKQPSIFSGNGTRSLITKIFSVLGPPTEKSWPGVTTLLARVGLVEALQIIPAMDLDTRFSQLSVAGRDLLQQLLTLNPADRITATDALQPEYLSDV